MALDADLTFYVSSNTSILNGMIWCNYIMYCAIRDLKPCYASSLRCYMIYKKLQEKPPYRI